MDNLYGYTMPNFLSTIGFKWIDPKQFDSNEYANNSSSKALHKLYNDYHLAPVSIKDC